MSRSNTLSQTQNFKPTFNNGIGVHFNDVDLPVDEDVADSVNNSQPESKFNWLFNVMRPLSICELMQCRLAFNLTQACKADCK
jgi:hypothetical protein